MVFLSICTALFDYEPQGQGELAIEDGELVYIIEKEDEWWKAKKRAANEEEEEPVGLIPNNYVEEVRWMEASPSVSYLSAIIVTMQVRADRIVNPGPTYASSKGAI